MGSTSTIGVTTWLARPRTPVLSLVVALALAYSCFAPVFAESPARLALYLGAVLLLRRDTPPRRAAVRPPRPPDGRWDRRGNDLVPFAAQPAVLRWSGWLAHDAELRLVAHPWSGIARVTWGGQTRTVDLFAETGREEVVPLPLPGARPAAPPTRASVATDGRARNVHFAAFRSSGGWRHRAVTGAREAGPMQYLLMICDEEKDQPQPGTPEFQAYMERWMALEAEYQAKGMLLRGGGKLQSVARAKTVRVRGGRVHVTDGPFAETKEVLGGYTVIECDTLAEALEYAAKIPVAEWGSVEVRPFVASRYEKG